MIEVAYAQFSEAEIEGALERIGTELGRRGFGVLAQIRVDRILREKIGATIEPVVILEVCSPRYAQRALAISRDAALLLPCKIVVSREGGRTRLALQRPEVVLRAWLPLPPLEELGREVERDLRAAIDAVATS